MKSARKYKRAEELEGEQRAAAESTANAVVAAGAGSGKTTVLAARYVHLLESARLGSGERLEPRNILVLTFTRKAAAEMYGRIYDSLAESAALAEEKAAAEGSAPQAAELAAHLKDCLALFSQAQISTFDSFASHIARSGSARFGVVPDFSVDEDEACKAASELALSFLLAHREEEAMRDLVSALGLEGAQDDVLADLALKRMSISSPPDFAAFHALQAKRLSSMLAESRQRILAMRDAALDYSGTKTTETSKRWLDAMAENPGENEVDFLSFIALFDGLRKPASNSKDEASQFLSDSVEGIRGAIDTYRNIAMTREAHPSRLALYERLDDFRKEWDSSRRAAKVLTFRDVAVLALDTLNADDEVRRYYQSLYRYIMIDEFQDDDELQKRILYLLAASPSFESSRRPDAPRQDGAEPAAGDLVPDKLFFVGDEKQSIYLFRGADVSVFRRLSSELSPLASGLRLSRNYRSEPGIIDMINAIFPDVMASIDPEKGHRDFEAQFESLEPRASTPGVTSRFVYLELPRRDPADGRAMRDPAECEAWEVARIVHDAVVSESFMVADRKSGTTRPARYEDFAVLLRSTGNQVHFEKYFRLYGVPYGSENACGLFSEAVACDLYYALRLALYPDDRNALAAYLRSPFAGLSDESVARILLSERDTASSAVGALEAADSLLGEKERGALARGAATMAELSGMIDREPIASCLCRLWFECGYRAALLRDPVASAFEEHFELLHSMAVDADLKGRPLASFVAELELFVGKPDKLEVNLPRESSRGVRIMTVHKSKGLEFPVVILSQANNVGQDGSSREAWYWEDELGPTFRPPAGTGRKSGASAARSRNAFFEASKERRTAMERAELKRLLYVALTRAESHIIVTATAPRSNDTTGKSFRGLLARPLGLFEPPSPLVHSDGEFQARTQDIVSLEGFGELTALASGALVGIIPERSDLEYFNLVAGSRKGKLPKIEFSGIPLVERTATSVSTSVTAIAERYEGKKTPDEASRIELAVDSALKMPPGLQSDAWGSLVHAALEEALGQGKSAGRSLGALQKTLEDKLSSVAAAEAAVHRAKALAKVFLDSELGRRALASEERRVELKIAISLKDDALPNLGRRSIGPRYARGSIDLAFVESGKVVVVDYKTDSYLAIGAHAIQVAAYEKAASDIFRLPSEAWIFYLYGGGRAVRVGSESGVPGLEAVLRLSEE